MLADSSLPSSASKAELREDASVISVGSTSSKCVSEPAAPVPEANGQAEGTIPKPLKNAGIELSRRALPEVEQDPDVCSICLDEFTDEDPGNGTQCGHSYHLQCIMQWAQRSHECPMCFKALRLQDETLNELLPFGEYRPPEQSSTPSHVLMGLEAWELDHLLARLAVHGNGRRRRGRNGARAQRAATQEALAESSTAASVAATSNSAAAGIVSEDSHRSRQNTASTPISMQRSDAHQAGVGSGNTHGAYPASWPPASHSRQYSRETTASGGDHEGHPSSPAVDLRTRWAAVSSRAKESLSKTTKELRSLWARGSNSPGPGHSHASSGTAT